VNIIRFMELTEGRRTEAYQSPEGGLPTLGIGHKLLQSEFNSGIIRINGQDVAWRNGLTEDQVDNLCRQDLHIASECINHHVTVQLTPNQLRALTSFVFTVGTGNFERSSLLSRLNRGDFGSVPGQLRLWNKMTVNGVKVVSPALADRREFEIREWLSGVA